MRQAAAVGPWARSRPRGSTAWAAPRALGRFSGQAFLIGAVAVAAAISLGMVGFQSRHALTHDVVPVAFAPLVLWMFFSERYEISLAILLLYLGLLDGVAKLYSGSNVVTLGRDVLLYAIAAGAVARLVLRRSSVSLPPFTGFVIAWVVVCLLQLANPVDASLSHSLASLRPHLEFVPLFFFGYLVLRSEQRLRGLLLLLVIVAAANGVVDLVQSRLTPAQLASWGPGYAGLEHGTALRVARVFISGGQAHVRPTGLGGTDGFGGLIGVIALPAAAALLSSFRRSLKVSWLLVPATMLTIVGVVTSETRLALGASVITLVVFLTLTMTSRRGVTALLLTMAIAVAGWFIVSSFVSSNVNRYSSIAPSEALSTAIGGRRDTFGIVSKYIASYPLGAGIGSVGPAGAQLAGGPHSRQLNGETEFSFLLVETGIPGLIVMVALTLAAIFAGLRLRRIADPGVQRCLMALTAILVSLLAAWFLAVMTAESPTAPTLWLCAGGLSYWYGEMRAGRVRLRPRRLQASLAQH